MFVMQDIRQKIRKLHALYEILQTEEDCTKKRQYWVRPLFHPQQRLLQGASHNLVKEMQEKDKEKYVNYFRMKPEVFEELLTLVTPLIEKEYVARDPISPATRLHLTLRYMASGDSMASISYAFRVGHNTVSKIISETSEAIWNVLKDTVFPKDNPESWQTIADEFEALWDYPNCIGAVDGKHVALQVCLYICVKQI